MNIPYDFSKKRNIIKALEFTGKEQKKLFKCARWVRSSVFGNRVEARSVIEYSNICQQECKYCGLHSSSKVKRYVLKSENVLRRVQRLYNHGRRVIMFQTGECHSERYFDKLYFLLKEIKARHKDISIICCLGNLKKAQMKKLRSIGIERYLIKFETSDSKLYKKIKPSDTLARRLKALHTAKELGFQVSSGNIIGLPGQTLSSIADDLLLLKKLDLPMVSNSVFVPNDLSEFAGEAAGDLNLALNATAILRILCPTALIPSTSSLETLKKGTQYKGLMAGANTITLHDGTPKEDEDRFILYRQHRAIPKDTLFEVAEKAGLAHPGYSLIRNKPASSLFHHLVIKNIKLKKPAVIFEGRKYTYKKILSMTSRFSSFLEKKKIREGDTLILSVFDSIDFVIAFLSCLRLGIKVGAVDPATEKQDWKTLIKEIKPDHILTTGKIAGTLKDKRTLRIAEANSSNYFLDLINKYPKSEKIVSPDHNNTAIILFTSGTTGSPKGVIHTYKDLFTDIFPREVLNMSKKDTVFSASRMHTSFGLGNSLIFPFAKGASSILSRNIPNPYSIKKILKYKPTLFFAVPSIYSLFTPYADELKPLMKNVRIFISSGEKLYEDLFKEWASAYERPLLECYGTTEMCHPFISNFPEKEKRGSCGYLLKGFEVKFSKSGRVFYRGPSLTVGYYNDEETTKRRIVKGWLKSDDIGHMTASGKFHFDGRINHIVKSGGKWISVLDIENKLKRSPLVKDIAISKSRSGLEYYVSLSRKTDPSSAREKIRTYCMRKLKINEFPGQIHMINKVPRTTSGKIDRKKLKG